MSESNESHPRDVHYADREAVPPSTPAFRFAIGQKIIFKRGMPAEEPGTILSHRNDDGVEKYRIATAHGVIDWVPASDLSEITPADRTRKAVESLGLGKAGDIEELPGGMGHRARGSSEAKGEPGD